MLVGNHIRLRKGEFFTVNIVTSWGHAYCQKGTWDVCKDRISDNEIKLISRGGKKVGEFTKADLKDGMRVFYRNAGERIVVLGGLYEQIGTYLYTSGCLTSWGSDLLFSTDMQELDIMRVVDRDGTVLFEREDKSQQQIEFEKLQNQITALQLQADKLKSTL